MIAHHGAAVAHEGTLLSKTPSRNKLLTELKQLAKEFAKQFPEKEITRDYYRKNSQWTGDIYTTYYPDFESFKAAAGLKPPVVAAQKKAEVVELPIDKKVEIEKERIISKTSEWKLKFEHLSYEYDQLEKELELVLNLKEKTPQFMDIQPKLPSGTSESIAVAVLSDWHSEELVLPGQVSGRNEFNLEICEERVTRCAQGVQRLWEIFNRDTNVQTLVLAVLGDFISGTIHEDQAESNLLQPSDAIYRAQNLLWNTIQFLLQNTSLKEIIVVCHSGNHGRMTKKQRIATEIGNSLEQYMYYNLRDLFKDEPRVRFQIAEGYHSYLNLFGSYLIRFHHGHAMRYQGGVGGIYIPVNKAINEWNKVYRNVRLDVFGHFHQYIDAGNFVCNGSLIGYNAYAVSIKAAYERPQQAFFLVNKKYNEKTIAAPIFVTDDDVIHP